MSAPETAASRGYTVITETCVPMLNPKICLGTSIKGGGRGLYAKERIAAGEMVWREKYDLGLEAIPRSWEYIEGLDEEPKQIYLHFSYCACHLLPMFALFSCS